MFVYIKGKEDVKRFLDNVDALGLGTPGGGVTTGLVVGTIAGAALAAGTTVVTGGGAVVIAGIVTAIGGVVGVVTAEDIDWTALTMFTEYSADNLKNLGCEITPAKQNKEEG